ncbi:sugar nucleotide-binding protein [Acidovorax sp. SUPP950]|uniref:SDR family oxidoreductase n=1 Tax=unclassified Acidovorax TaxID=2684926 RepID=UPI0023D4B1D9|nr:MULTISPECIES: NAD(P)-dependent oxidoreductase [Comamonadaceae]WOI45021.1 NAD(P)-dependent oxidoreductase [Paracidovorax avenae]GKS77947.1 sugar nucleotide-binding protein [Acidovorax sp. SUPP950]
MRGNDLLELNELAALEGSRILITGAGGMLGQAFARRLAEQVPTALVAALDRHALDVRQREQAQDLRAWRPDIVIHCAVCSDVNWCEDHADAAAQVQIEGTRHVVELARECGARFFYPQTFLIYDGSQPVDEATPPRPLSVYGRLKLEAEHIVLEASPQALTVRMGGFFGEHARDKNFVGKLIPHLAGLLRSGVDRMEIGDRIWQPTLTDDLAYNSLLLLARGETGRFCMASHGQASFFELAREIVLRLGLDRRIEIARVPAETMARKEKAVRPDAVVMRNAALQARGLDRQRTWQDSLAAYLDHPYFTGMFAP